MEHNTHDVAIMMSRSLDILQDRHIKQFSLSTLIELEGILTDEYKTERGYMPESEEDALLHDACAQYKFDRLMRVHDILSDILEGSRTKQEHGEQCGGELLLFNWGNWEECSTCGWNNLPLFY